MTYINTRDKSHQPQNQISESLTLAGGCCCGKLKYRLRLRTEDEAKTSLCHCTQCKKAFGGAFGVTVKVPVTAFKYTIESGRPTVHKSESESGSPWFREFCNECGNYMCEYGEQARDHFRNVTLGSLDEPSALSPRGEFYCSQREAWMPAIPGILHHNGSGEH